MWVGGLSHCVDVGTLVIGGCGCCGGGSGIVVEDGAVVNWREFF